VNGWGWRSQSGRDAGKGGEGSAENHPHGVHVTHMGVGAGVGQDKDAGRGGEGSAENHPRGMHAAHMGVGAGLGQNRDAVREDEGSAGNYPHGMHVAHMGVVAGLGQDRDAGRGGEGSADCAGQLYKRLPEPQAWESRAAERRQTGSQGTLTFTPPVSALAFLPFRASLALGYTLRLLVLLLPISQPSVVLGSGFTLYG
jgi:hypothetical protein